MTQEVFGHVGRRLKKERDGHENIGIRYRKLNRKPKLEHAEHSYGRPLAVEVVGAIREGDVVSLQRLPDGHPGLATAGNDDTRDCKGMPRSLLDVATDWPGHFPNTPATVAVLIAAGADVNARFAGPHTETPLHWAANSDDVAVLGAILNVGAVIEALGAVIGGGTPLADAVAFGQWRAARRLVERGARTILRHAAPLGLLDHVEKHFANDNPFAFAPWSPRPTQPSAPIPDEITNAFWFACPGGQRQSPEYLLRQVGELN